MKKVSLLFILFSLLFCSKTKEQEINPLILLALPSVEQSVKTEGLVKTTKSGNVNTSEVNARDYYNKTHCSLSKGGISTKKTDNWELSFSRFKIATNSGVSGNGKSGACDTNSTNFSSVTKTSCINFTQDTNISYSSNTGSGLKTNTEPGNSILKDWYSYNSNNHILTTKNKVYLIKSSDGKDIFKIQILDYYDKAGTSGHIKFKWEKL